MDRALDEIVAERNREGRTQGRRTGRRTERYDYPREGIRKDSLRSKQSTRNIIRNIDSEWVHDKFDDNTGRRSLRIDRRYSPSPDFEQPSAKLRVENLHYDLTEDDLDDLFNRIGPVLDLSLVYDRAGRSEGIAYVTYEFSHDAKKAIQEFDGANAKGQPIHLITIPSGPSGRRRNLPPARSRSLFDRVTMPPRKSRSESDFHKSGTHHSSETATDRYTPWNNARPSSDPRRRRDGRRINERNGAGRNERMARDGRPKKTQEELDAEMEDYWGGLNNNGTVNNASGSTTVGIDDEMRE